MSELEPRIAAGTMLQAHTMLRASGNALRSALGAYTGNVKGNVRVTSVRNYSPYSDQKIVASPMVYIAGEEMTHYCMNLIMDKWINPKIDTSKWEFFDLSCKSRDDTEDQVRITNWEASGGGPRVRSVLTGFLGGLEPKANVERLAESQS